MDVILLERIDKLGQMGDVVKVKSGYARNFLLPQKKALRATEENKKRFDAQRTQMETANLENRTEAEKLGKKMSELAIILVRQAGEAGQLYGSVNARDIAASVTEAGFTITRQQVELVSPIKALGLYQVKVALHPEVSVAVTANVARSVEEAKIQTKTGHAVTNEEEQMAAAPAASPDAAEEAADEAVAEQADDIFEEGAQPEAAPEEEPGEEEVAEEKVEADSGEEKAE